MRGALRLPFVITLAGASTFACGEDDTGDSSANCPAEPPRSMYCDESSMQGCKYTVDCQGGPQVFVVSCGGSINGWKIGSKDCDSAKPYDSCPNTNFHCDPATGWSLLLGTNPPAPCPTVAPTPGAQCVGAPFGGWTSPCGYPCSTGSGWMVMNCVEGAWETTTPCG